MEIKHPFLAAWLAILKDKSQKFRSLADFSEGSPPFLTDLVTKDVGQFFYLDAIGNKVHGVDVLNRLFIINGCCLELPLPVGDYQLIAKSSVQIPSDGGMSVRYYSFGLQATVKGKNVKRIFTIYPDGSVVLEDK